MLQSSTSEVVMENPLTTDDSSCLVKPQNNVSVKPKQFRRKPVERTSLQKPLPVSSSVPHFDFPLSVQPPGLWHLADSRSETSLTTKDDGNWFSEDREHCLIKKWPPLTEADLKHINKDEEEDTSEDISFRDSKSTVKGKMFDLECLKHEIVSDADKDELGALVPTLYLLDQG